MPFLVVTNCCPGPVVQSAHRRCPVCGKTFFGEDKLTSHYHTHGSADELVDQSTAHDEKTATGTSASSRRTSTGMHSSQSGHYVKRHISEGDRVCLGTFCDIMRCEVVERQLLEGPRPRGPPTASGSSGKPVPTQGDSLPDEFKAARDACDRQAMATLESRCKVVMQQCTIGLLNVLSVKEYKDIEANLSRKEVGYWCTSHMIEWQNELIEPRRFAYPTGELYRNICAYLRCERYWDEGRREVRAVSPFVASLIGFILATGFFVCYYVVWVVFDYTPLPEEALLQKLPNGTTIRRVSSSVTITRQHSAPLVGSASYHQRFSTEIPLRRHFSHYHERARGYQKRDQQPTLMRQLSQGYQGHQGQNPGQMYPGLYDLETAQANSKHVSPQQAGHRSSAPVAVSQGSRYHYERPLRSPLTGKDIPNELPSPVYQQPIKEYRDQFSAVQMSPSQGVHHVYQAQHSTGMASMPPSLASGQTTASHYDLGGSAASPSRNLHQGHQLPPGIPSTVGLTPQGNPRTHHEHQRVLLHQAAHLPASQSQGVYGPEQR
ncbi:hypothetical protein BIW11_03430 [Tropilaelaps mercedesae]|uniref:C2H2-type domain-containing protein n=1 Tax=Tropilaelaps mercedesae TaxID=418985 RepID=A0A1V9XLI4_9ACAR|nr:hypothetical protein BIW11_03430 [Tropilaelaps mercedesae]